MKKLLIGLTSFNDLPYLREVLPVLKELGGKVVVMDNAENDEVKEFVGEGYVRHKDGNLGYGRSYNEILKANPGYEYFLVCTNDVLLDAGVVRKFLKKMDADKDLMMCAGKLHHWDFKGGEKTDKIDSLGIMGTKKHHFYDLGAGEVDEGQYDGELGKVLGISGAVFLIRTSTVEKLGYLFDEKMWMYKEDIDLAYRLRWRGEKIKIFPEVWGWHARTLSKGKKWDGSRGRLESYKNHLLMLKKNFSFGFGIWIALQVIFYEFLKGTYVLFKYPKAFFAGMKTLLFVKGGRIVRLVSPKEMLKYFK
jgi:GT2 family glycosyltransferase